MNASTDRPDSALRAWLELGPERGRTEAIERALAATRRVPQRPGWSFPERWLPVNRALLAAAAMLIVVVGAAAIFLRPVSNVGPPASPTPAPTTQAASPSRDPGLVPAELMHNWVGAPRPLPGMPAPDAVAFGFQFGQLFVTANYVYGRDQ